MKKIALTLLLLVSSQAFADGYYHDYQRHHFTPMYTPTVLPSVYYAPTYYSGYYTPPVINTYPSASDILLPMAVGGLIGYALADKSSSSSSSSTNSYNVNSGEPLYQYQTIHDANCDCDKKLLVKIN